MKTPLAELIRKRDLLDETHRWIWSRQDKIYAELGKLNEKTWSPEKEARENQLFAELENLDQKAKYESRALDTLWEEIKAQKNDLLRRSL